MGRLLLVLTTPRRSLGGAVVAMAVACQTPSPGSGPEGGAAVHLRLVAAPATGEVAPIVRDALAGAARENRRLIVYVGAVWCEPCRRFHRAAERGELDGVFGDLTLLEFDQDRDEERLKAASYTSQYIPLFALPAPDGSASGQQLEGAIKGDGAVAHIVPRLARLLAR